MKLIIYMPALNEEMQIQIVINNLPQDFEGIDVVQYLVVDDGSTDETVTLAKAAGACVISHGRNLGVGAAFQTAVQFALENDADILASIDADGQFDSSEIPALIQPIIDKKAEMVMGNRFGLGMPKNMPPLKYWGNQRISELINYVAGEKFQDVSCGFRAYSREALFRLNNFADFTYTHETILALLYQKLQVSEISIKVKYDPDRKSRVAGSVIRYAAQTSKIILRVLLDYRPMRIFGTLAGLFILTGFLFILALFGYYFFIGSFTPYKSLGFIGLGLVIFGMLVLLIALISDMLNRIRINQNKLLYELKKMRYSK